MLLDVVGNMEPNRKKVTTKTISFFKFTKIIKTKVLKILSSKSI
jgi:hypothetical protein